MRKKLLAATLMSLVMFTANSAMAANDKAVKKNAQPAAVKETVKEVKEAVKSEVKEVKKDVKETLSPEKRKRPEFYDKNGNKLTERPQPGTKVYDKDGKEIVPFKHKRPEFYDKNGNKLTERPQPGTKVYDKDGKEIVPFRHKKPEFYDKNGNKLTEFPKPGTKVYDKNGKEIEFKKPNHPRPELNLTDEQRAKADKMREESRTKMKPVFTEMKSLNEQINKIYDNEKLSQEQKEKQVKPLMEKISKLHTQADELRKADMQKFEALLTDEQKVKLEEFRKNHKPPMRKETGKAPAQPQKPAVEPKAKGKVK